jgi:hypothetical protein
LVGQQGIEVPKQGMTGGTLFIEINEHVLESDKTKIELAIYNGAEKIETTTTNFLSPRSFD